MALDCRDIDLDAVPPRGVPLETWPATPCICTGSRPCSCLASLGEVRFASPYWPEHARPGFEAAR